MRMTRQGVLPIVLAAFTFLHAGCGEESTSNEGDTGGSNGGETNGGATNGGGSGGTTSGTSGTSGTGASLLGPMTAGLECSSDDDCGPMGTCVTELSGGAASMLGLPGQPAPGGYCSASCTEDTECGEGGACFGTIPVVGGGECRATCVDDSECREGYECAMLNTDADLGGFEIPATCQPLPEVDALGDDEAGKLCQSDADCPNGRCGSGGLCTGTCAKDSDCGSGGLCIPGLYGSAGTCVEGCASDADCQNAAMGYGCSGDEPRQCVTRLIDGAVGEPCNAENQATVCAGGSCRETAFGTDYPEGYCVGSCDVDADCGTGGVCINGTTCLKGCNDAGDCRTGYECIVHPLADETSTSPVCFPESTDDATDGGAGETDAGATGDGG